MIACDARCFTSFRPNNNALTALQIDNTGCPKKKTGDFLRQPQIASGQVIYQNDGNFLEIMCVKFGGIWCHPRLAVPEKLPKNGPKSGVCLRGCKMVSF